MLQPILLLLSLIYAVPQDGQDAWALFRNRDYARALERFEKKEANLYPDWEVVHDAMGWCHFFLEDYDAAEAKFNEALQLNSSYKWSLDGLQALADLKAAPLQQAQELLDAARYSEARAAFQRIQEGLTVAPDGDLVPAMIGEAWCLHGLGRYKDAKSMFRSALKKKRSSADCYFGIGYCDYALLDYRNAIASLELGLKAQPGNYTAQITIAWSYYWRKKYERANKAFAAAAEMADSDWQAAAGKGWCLYQLNQKPAALNAFEEAIGQSPYAFSADLRAIAETEAGWHGLITVTGWSALRQQLNSWAQAEFETAIAWNPANSSAQAGLAFAHFRQGAYDQALTQIRRVRSASEQVRGWSFPVQLADGSLIDVELSLLSLQSWCFLRQGNSADALIGFRSVRRDEPMWVDAICGEAWTLYSQGDYAGAEVVFAAALSLQPGYPDAVSGATAVQTWRFEEYSTAWSLYYAGSFEAARLAFEGVLQQDGHRYPKDRDDLLHASIGWTWLEQAQWTQAEQAFDRALQLAPASALALRGAAKLRLNQQKWEAAEAQYLKAMKSPEVAAVAEVHAELGWCLLQQNKLEKARHSFERAQEMDQNCATALAGKATLLLKREQLVEGRLAWERALSLEPTLADRWGLAAQMEEFDELHKLHSALGWAWFYRSAYTLAEEQFLLARQKDPNEFTVLRGLGMLMLETQRLKEGADYLRQYLERRPEHENPWGVWSTTTSALAWALYNDGEYKEALKEFRVLADLHKGQREHYADPYDGAGWCLFQQGKFSQARKEFLKAIEIAPRHESSLLGLEAVMEEDQ